MLWIDPRKGSGEFRQLFSAHSIELGEEEELPCGDFRILGQGVDSNGHPDDVLVGIERKALADFLTFTNPKRDRFTGSQIEKMRDTYWMSFLVVEGLYRPDTEGFVEELVEVRPVRENGLSYWRRVNQGSKQKPHYVLYSVVEGHLNTLRMRSGFHVVHTASKLATTWFVCGLYKWFQRPWDKHNSHLPGHYDPASMLRMDSPFERKVAMQLPSVGYDKSELIRKAFPGNTVSGYWSVQDMANADEEKWREVKWVTESGRNMSLGKETAARVVRMFRGLGK